VKFIELPSASLNAHNINRLPGDRTEKFDNMKYFYQEQLNKIIILIIEILVQAYPVLQASLIMLTESAVTTNVSAQAKWPMCRSGPESCVTV